ncbi:hypothetical protein Pmani_019465 [Petrolisthes manimaculis]|uniref:Uncharacterized protein n=1 Tax=Petrolisthes manimaculis TaxID=1843537 RepID=A0AAE1PID7_9EUCA|nr:hypothetical protein Pmani_019465 [Petrolisthes manimaculis]
MKVTGRRWADDTSVQATRARDVSNQGEKTYKTVTVWLASQSLPPNAISITPTFLHHFTPPQPYSVTSYHYITTSPTTISTSPSLQLRPTQQHPPTPPPQTKLVSTSQQPTTSHLKYCWGKIRWCGRIPVLIDPRLADNH